MTHRGRLRSATLLLVLLTGAWSADDPYAAWGHGRPQDALAPLHEQARTSDRWDAWFDLGLAALAAGRQGEGTAWLIAALQRAPERAEPRQALRAIDVAPPHGWLDRLGPLALPGLGWSGLTLLAFAGLGLGYGACATRRRGLALTFGGVLLALALPGRLAYDHDQARLLVVAVHDSQLYDSAGHPIAAIPAGTVLEQESAEVWAERVLVHDAQGHRGHLPLADTIAKP
jgi:hypothetical protein